MIMPSIREIEDRIRQAAIANGIDPETALKVARSEGLQEGTWQSTFMQPYGREPSYGPFQLLEAPEGQPQGLGNEFFNQTGKHAYDQANLFEGIDFALANVKKTGNWSAFKGAKRVGVSPFEGIGSVQAASTGPQMASAAPQAANAEPPQNFMQRLMGGTILGGDSASRQGENPMLGMLGMGYDEDKANRIRWSKGLRGAIDSLFKPSFPVSAYGMATESPYTYDRPKGTAAALATPAPMPSTSIPQAQPSETGAEVPGPLEPVEVAGLEPISTAVQYDPLSSIQHPLDVQQVHSATKADRLDDTIAGSGGSDQLSGGDDADFDEDMLKAVQDRDSEEIDESILRSMEEPDTELPNTEPFGPPTEAKSNYSQFRAENESPWGRGADLADAYMLFQGKKVGAFAPALQGYLGERLSGTSHREAREKAGGTYNTIYGLLSEGEKEYEARHPIGSMVNSIIGSAPTTIYATALGQGAVGAALTGAGRLAPTIAPTANALRGLMQGTLGYGTRGEELVGAGNAAARMASGVGQGVAEGGAAGVLQSGDNPEESIASQAGIGALVGGAINPALRKAGSMLMKPLTEATSARGTSQAIDYATGRLPESVMPRGDQITTNESVQKLASRIVDQETNTAQLQSFTEEALKTVGSSEKMATPMVIKQESNRISQDIERTLGQMRISPDVRYNQDMTTISNDVVRNMAQSGERGKILGAMNQINNALHNAQGPRVRTGKLYQDLTDKDSAIGRMLKDGTSDEKFYARKLKTMLDDLITRNLGPRGPYLSQHWADLKHQWKEIRTIEDAANVSGASGVLQPEAYRTSVLSHNGSIDANPTNKSSLLAQVATFLPEATKKGAAAKPQEGWGHVLRGMLGYGAAVGGGTAGLYNLTDLLPLAVRGGYLEDAASMLGAGAGIYSAGALRDKLLKNVMQSPYYRDIVSGYPNPAKAPNSLDMLLAPRKAAIPMASKLFNAPPPKRGLEFDLNATRWK